MTAHTLVNRQPDVDGILNDIRALHHNVYCNKWDEYDIIHIYYYFNDWWKENLAGCAVSHMMPKSSVRDVMDLVADYFAQLVSHSNSSSVEDINSIYNRTSI